MADEQTGQSNTPESITGNRSLDSQLDRLAEDYNAPATNTSSEDGSGDTTGSQDRAGSAEDATPSGSRDGAQPTDNRQTQTQQPNKGQQQSANSPRPGDLVDRETGEVVARAGQERRLYERADAKIRAKVEPILRQLQQQAQQLPQVQNELAQYRAALGAYQQADAVAKSYNLTPQDRDLAYRMIGAWRQDPVSTVKFLVAELAKSGITVEGITDGLNTTVMQRMLDDRLNPILGPIEQHQRQAQELEQLDREVERDKANFLQRYPDAGLHAEHIAKLMTQSDLNEVEAYYKVREWAMQQGFDFNQPLGPQWQARQSQGQQQQQQQQQQQTRPLPGGFTPTRGAGQVQDTRDYGNMSTRDIVRESMRDAGLQLM